MQLNLSGRDTHLADESVDVVFLIDILQMITDREALLQELHRALKQGGIIFATSEHLKESEFRQVFSEDNLFTLVSIKQRYFKFRKNKKQHVEI